MIVNPMTRDEVLEEVSRDYKWFLREKMPKFAKLNKGWLSRNIGPKGARRFLNISTYKTPRHNKVKVVWMVESLGHYKNKLCWSIYYLFMTPRGMQYLLAINNVTELLVFTSHSIDRLQERSGMTVNDMMEYIAVELHYNMVGRVPDEDTDICYYGLGDKGVFIAKSNGKWGETLLTFVNSDKLYENQTKYMLEAKKAAMEYAEEQIDLMAKPRIA